MVHVDGTHMIFKATLDSAFTSGLLIDRIMIKGHPLFLVVLANVVVFLHVIVPPNILSIGFSWKLFRLENQKKEHWNHRLPVALLVNMTVWRSDNPRVTPLSDIVRERWHISLRGARMRKAAINEPLREPHMQNARLVCRKMSVSLPEVMEFCFGLKNQTNTTLIQIVLLYNRVYTNYDSATSVGTK